MIALASENSDEREKAPRTSYSLFRCFQRFSSRQKIDDETNFSSFHEWAFFKKKKKSPEEQKSKNEGKKKQKHRHPH